mmetsp:Transcript_33629/g.83249  ORF Transcript_33629/g.83249 Transcript_33629/m.83249 type:complete len:460 (-) Transcript_33629:193-1572(-)
MHSATFEVRPISEEKGSGLVALRNVAAGEVFHSEWPFCVVQHPANSAFIRACTRCCRFAGTCGLQLATLFSGTVEEAVLNELPSVWGQEKLSDVVECPQGCGEVYCGQECRAADWKDNHNFMCVGPLDDDAPLVQFKQLAIEYADTLLLAGKVFASLVNRAQQRGRGAEAVREGMNELMGFTQGKWDDVARPAGATDEHGEGETLRLQVLAEAFELLKAALLPASPLFAPLFESDEFLSRLLGMFERNNIDVEIQSPLKQLCHSWAQQPPPAASSSSSSSVGAAAAGPASNPALRRLLEAKTVVMRYEWDEDETGNYQSTAADTSPDDAHMDEETEDDDEADEAADEQRLASIREDVRNLTMEQLLAEEWPNFHGTAFFPSVARVNHSCVPNIKMAYPRGTCEVCFGALRGISCGEEMSTSYIDSEAPRDVRQTNLLEYGFVCRCDKCESEAARVNLRR